MTYSNTYSSPSSPTNFNPFSGMGMRKGGRPSLFPGSGDGSTLNLDFTTGVLDSRLTFSRASNATFVNSSGYVEYAAHNLYYNTNFATIPTGTDNPSLTSKGWDYVFSTGKAVFNTDGSVSMTAENNRVGLLRSSGFAGTGRRLIFSVDITSSGDTGVPPSQLVNEGTKTNDAYYINGALWTAGNVVGPCTLSFVFTSNTAGNASTYFGIGMSGNSTGFATFANPRWGFCGSVNQLAYSPNTSATNANYSTAAYHAPRFDYSPTNIGEPRGLLIEGQAINLCRYSSDPQLWAGATNIAAPVNGSGLAPDGVSIPKQLIMGSGSYHAQPTASTNEIGTYTFSIYLKAASPQQVGVRVNRQIDGNNSNMIIANVTTYWQRFSVSVTTNAIDSIEIDLDQRNLGAGSVVQGPGVAATFLMWGAQLELGSVATSYIPTGASSVTRPADFITSASSAANSKGTEFSINDFTANASSNTSYTYLLQYDRLPRVGNIYPAALYGRTTAGSTRIDVRDFSGTSIELGATGLNCFANYAITNTNLKVAIAQDGTTYPSGAVNGVVTTTTSGTINNSSGCEWLQLGNSTAVSGAFNPIRIQKLQCIPRRLSNLQLQQITDPNYVAPTLDINFVPMTTGADLTAKAITFTRLTNATFINTAGAVQFSDANLLSDSESFLTGWTDNGLITPVATESITNPIGTTGAVKLVVDESGGSKSVTQNLPVVAGFQYTFRVWIKAGTSSAMSIGYYNGSFYGCTLTKLSGPGTITGSGTGTSYQTITELTTAWTQIQVTLDTVITSGNGQWYIYPNTPGNAIGNSIYIWGAQCNIGATANPYYKTTTAAYQAPRFNNAVLTSRANYIKQSNSFTTAPWVQKNGTHLVTLTAAYEAAPPGFTGTATRITSSNALAGLTQPLNVPNISGKQIAISFYGKSNKSTSQYCTITDSNVMTVLEIPTTWTRMVAYGNNSTEIGLLGFIETLDISIFGMQVEYISTGTLVTPYIPTTTIGAISKTTKPRGILIEQNTENLTLYSSTLYAGSWSASAGITRSQDTLLPDPSGSNNACQITKQSGYQYVIVNQNTIPTFTVAANSTRYLTASVWLRVATSGQVPSIGIFDQGGTAFGTSYQARADNDLVTISSGSGADIDITFGSVLDWVRVSVTRVFANATASPVSFSNLIFYIYPNRQNTNAATIYAWGAQMEAASGATTYLPTVGSTSVRSLESCYLSGSNFTSWYNTLNPTGTFYMEFDRPEASGSVIGNPTPIGFGEYALGKLIMVSAAESIIGTSMFVGIWTNVNFFSGPVTGAVTRKENNKLAFSFNGPAMRAALNTTGLSNLITGAGSMNIKEVLYIGSNGVINSSIPTGSRDWLNSCVQRVVFYPTEFTPAQLTASVS